MTNSVSQSQHLIQTAIERRTSPSWRLTVRRGIATCTAQIMRLPAPFRTLLQPLCVMLEGASLGVLRPTDVERMVAETYDSEPQFYDPRHYRLRHEERLLPVLTQLAGDGRRLLDAFCGQGREAEMFARNGYDITAIDRVPWMIQKATSYARESGFAADFITANFYSFNPIAAFDVVYTSCWMYSTVQARHRRVQFLKRCHELCNDHGLVVISYVSGAQGSRLAAWIRFLIARLVAVTCRGNTRTEFGERLYTGLFWHHLDEETVTREIEQAGLSTVDILFGKNAEPVFRILRPQTTEGTE